MRCYLPACPETFDPDGLPSLCLATELPVPHSFAFKAGSQRQAPRKVTRREACSGVLGRAVLSGLAPTNGRRDGKRRGIDSGAGECGGSMGGLRNVVVLTLEPRAAQINGGDTFHKSLNPRAQTAGCPITAWRQ